MTSIPDQPATPYPPQPRMEPLSPPYPPPYPPSIGQPPAGFPAPPPIDKSKRFLNLSTGALVAVITAILLLCCVGPVVLCFFGGFVGAIGEATKKAPTATISGCMVHSDPYLPTADITYTVKNNNATDEVYWVGFVVTNSSGSQVGKGSDIVDIGGGQSVVKTATVYLDAPGGQTCAISDIT